MPCQSVRAVLLLLLLHTRLSCVWLLLCACRPCVGCVCCHASVNDRHFQRITELINKSGGKVVMGGQTDKVSSMASLMWRAVRDWVLLCCAVLCYAALYWDVLCWDVLC